MSNQEMSPNKNKKVLDEQKIHWDKKFSGIPDMFGDSPSEAALKAVEVFRKEGWTKILELGGGQGRDTILFARKGLNVTVLDYSKSAIEAIERKAEKMGLTHLIETGCQDVREPLQYENETFDGCFSHMLYCMALTTNELEFLSQEIRRILKPGGLNIYTVRHTGDPHYGSGIHRGENMYEIGGFISHFFTREKVHQLAKGFEIIDIEEFEEYTLPRKLLLVALMKT